VERRPFRKIGSAALIVLPRIAISKMKTTWMCVFQTARQHLWMTRRNAMQRRESKNETGRLKRPVPDRECENSSKVWPSEVRPAA
jgi:hypothetical protein